MTLRHGSAGAEATEALRARVRAATETEEEDRLAGCAWDHLRMGELDTLLHDYRRLVLESARSPRRAPCPYEPYEPIAPPVVVRFFHHADAGSLALRDVPALLQEYRALLAAAAPPPCSSA